MALRSPFGPCLDCWYWQGLRIRCALLPNEPRLLDVHWAQGCELVEHGQLCPWKMSVSTLTLLLNTACDPILPWHWRGLCLDHAYRSLYAIQHLAQERDQHVTLNRLRNRLASLQLAPSIEFSELAQGNPYE